MSQNKPTTREHYIPQCYLNRFSADEKDFLQSDEKYIYQYDVISCTQILKPVPIKSICYEKDLYEFKDDSGNILHRNLIEKSFRVFEGEFAKTFRSIQSKALCEDNYQIRSFLSLEEKAFLVFFISTVIVRNPDILRVAQKDVMEFLGDQITEASARNLILQTCLPIYNTFDVKEKTILDYVMESLNNMSFQIGIADKYVFWTSDRPVILHGKNFDNCNEVIMPISPHLVLYMKPYKNTKKGFYNRLIKLDKKFVEYINSSIVTHCKRWVFSNTLLTSGQIKWISKERNHI